MRTVTALFDDYDDASNAVSELERAGIPSSDISIVASNADRRHGEDSIISGSMASLAKGLFTCQSQVT